MFIHYKREIHHVFLFWMVLFPGFPHHFFHVSTRLRPQERLAELRGTLQNEQRRQGRFGDGQGVICCSCYVIYYCIHSTTVNHIRMYTLYHFMCIYIYIYTRKHYICIICSHYEIVLVCMIVYVIYHVIVNMNVKCVIVNMMVIAIAPAIEL